MCRLTQVLHGIRDFHDLEQSDSNSTHPGSSWTLFHSHNVSSTITELTSKVLTKTGQILLSLQDWYVLLCDRCNDWEPFHSCVLMRTVVISKLKMSRGEYYTSHLSLWFIGHNVRYTDMFKLFCT